MIAEPASQLRLLDLQAVDTALAQLAHKRKTLPELAALEDADRRLAAVNEELVEVQTQLGDVIAEQTRIEGEVDGVRERAARDEQRMTSGGLPAKDLEGLQHEITSLARRQATLEDTVIEVMEQREALEAQENERLTLQGTIQTERDDLIVARDLVFTEIDAANVERSQQRDAIAGEIPDDLLALYEKVRAPNGGMGAAMLRQRRCEGCRMELASSEISALRSAAADSVLRCDNCRIILVRTAESGL
ncbi:hypothetical protein SAMN05444157_1869 [Frankineae bacterium MT45]|nr:hypothetical protein SAMN05444157_1869 [Frankineae bacterium MT45]